LFFDISLETFSLRLRYREPPGEKLTCTTKKANSLILNPRLRASNLERERHE
jgi:hypothetical protein